MKNVKDIIPWKVTDISLRPYAGFWSMNPSIHFDGETWRCVLRCCDYCMPSGRTVRSKNAGFAGQQTRNAMVILDPTTWRATRVYKMHERDGLARATTPHVGFEDMRLFRTDAGGLQGIAAALHLQRGVQKSALQGSPQSQPPEQVIVSFDEEYNVVAARPIRGEGWSGPQKNWVPFDDVAEPRFLYSIAKGTLFDPQGRLGGDARLVRPSVSARPLVTQPPPSTPPPPPQEASKESPPPRSEPKPKRDLRTKLRGGDVQLIRGRRVMLDAGSSHPTRMLDAGSSHPTRMTAGTRGETGGVRVMNGRVSLPKYEGLRGGSQLIRVGDGSWLGVAHEMTFVNGKKLYWHIWYLTNSCGKMTAASEPMKLAPNGIEFAAGMAIDDDRVTVSFGVDDIECKLGETRLSAVMDVLKTTKV